MKDISSNIVSLEEYKKQIDKKRKVIKESYRNPFSGCTEREKHLLDVIESLAGYIESLCSVIEKDAGNTALNTVESTEE